MQDTLRITTSEGAFSAYVARPANMSAGASVPTIVVIHEVFGVNADMRQSCNELAAQGYLAICPDLFWRIEPGIDMTDRTEAELAKALTLYNAFDLDAGVRDITAAIAAVRALPGSNDRVCLVGYCLGGLMSYLTTTRAAADAAVAYYPGNADMHLDEAGGIGSPLMMHLAEEDEYIPPNARRQIVAALGRNPQVQFHSYPGCRHAFARHGGIAYDAQAAALANDRTQAFLAQHLKSD